MKKTTLLIIRFYQNILSPYLQTLAGRRCRFVPSCSEYSYDAIEKHGIFKGIFLSIIRIAKCNPLFLPGVDPIK